MIEIANLTKRYSVYEKEPGLVGSLRSLLRRRFRTVEAVNQLTFTVNPGEIIGFLGPNGAGKTTTLKMLAGLLHPTSGHVRVLGHLPQARSKAFLRSITMVMGQKQQLTWDLTPADSFLVNKSIYEISDDDYKRRLGELSALLDLGTLLNRQVRRLSLGERMKCELAAALLHEPKVLFLDEPTIGLDVNMQGAIRQFIRDYNQRTGATVLLTSHYMADVTALADRILVIDRGHLTFDGDLQELHVELQPHKVLKLSLHQPISLDELSRYGTVRKLDRLKGELLVERAQVRAVAIRLLSELDLVDITIEEVPIEETIGQLFQGRHRSETNLG